MTTIAIVVGSVFAYVVVAGRVYRYIGESDRQFCREMHRADIDALVVVIWPVTLVVCMAAILIWPIARFVLIPVWNLGARRRSKLPEARVRR